MKIRMTGLAGLLAAAALVLAGCGGESTSTESSPAESETTAAETTESEGGDSYTIGFLLPETAVARYESKDKPYFEAALAELCPDCTLLYANANGDAAEQQSQALSMLAQGVDVLVVDPLDGVAAASIVDAAKAQNVPVVAYDRLIQSPDLTFVISNDYYTVGELQGQALVDKLQADGITEGGIIMMNGAVTDNNAGNIKAGALSVIENSPYEVLASIETWDPAEAQQWAASQIAQFGDKIVGVYSANDGNAIGAIAAFKAAGVPVPPMTGLDASLAGLQAILAGDLYMTTYNAFQSQAAAAAKVAFELAQGKTPAADAEVEGIPAVLNPPQAITIDKILPIIVGDDFFTVEEICTAEYADACAAAGIQ